MKTTWTEEYVNQHPFPHKWLRAKKAQLEAKHGVPFDFYRAHGKWVFSVTPNFRNIQPINAPGWNKELLGLLKKGRSFIWLKENLGKSSWDWETLFAVSLYLAQTKQVSFAVNRNGKACGLHRRQR